MIGATDTEAAAVLRCAAAADGYARFIDTKTQGGADSGFAPVWMPDFLFDFQASLTEWAIRKGRAALFADCGLGKTPMGLVWAENVARFTGGRVLFLTPLAVGPQIDGCTASGKSGRSLWT